MMISKKSQHKVKAFLVLILVVTVVTLCCTSTIKSRGRQQQEQLPLSQYSYQSSQPKTGGASFVALQEEKEQHHQQQQPSYLRNGNTTNTSKTNEDLHDNPEETKHDPIQPKAAIDVFKRGAGIVIVDIREDGSVSDLALKWLRTALPTLPTKSRNSGRYKMRPHYNYTRHLPVELYIAQEAHMDDKLQAFVAQHNTTWLTVKRIPRHVKDIPSVDLNSKDGSHIAKTYAMKHSSFDFPVYFDTDVMLCQGWWDRVVQTVAKHPNVDLVWTQNPSPFGATKGVQDVYVNKVLIDPVVDEYVEFPERQSGTIIALRRSTATENWLQEVMNIFAVQNGDETLLEAKRRAFTDQAAFREATFLYRNFIVEHVIPGEKEGWACRSKKSTGACQCGPCLLVHNKDCFRDMEY